MFIGAIIGLIAGFAISNTFIFPAEILDIKLANVTIGDILRILAGGIVILIGGWVGGFIGSCINDIREVNKNH